MFLCTWKVFFKEKRAFAPAFFGGSVRDVGVEAPPATWLPCWLATGPLEVSGEI
jgi:hypothetical protein